MIGIGSALVTLQFVLLGVLAALGARGLAVGRSPLDVPLLAGAGIALGLWALSANRIGNFNIRPDPRQGGRLVRHGPYRWIRHPMYSALLLAGVACTRAAGDLTSLLALGALALVLGLKARVEERALVLQHPDYRSYQQQSWRFVPFVY